MDTIAIAQVNNAPPHTIASDWEHTYRPLPDLFFGLAILWMLLVFVWTLNTWAKRRWQTRNLQWVLTVIPAMKSLVMSLSFVFWYSCLHLKTCSFWVAFGVFVSRIFFETACFVTFLLISYGYCIMHEQLSLTERRSVAGLTSLLYLTLTGYKAAVPQFAVLIIFIYAVLLYVIMAHIARNLSLLREQLQQIQNEGVHMMQNAVHTKYTMFRKFQGAMLAMMVAEFLMHAQPESVFNEYWVRLLVRETTEVIIFFFIGWTFRSREQTPFFNVMPTSNSNGQRTLPPIYSVEIDERQFNKLDYKEWHIGVPTSISRTGDGNRPMLVIVQNPGVSDPAFIDNFSKELIQTSAFKMPANFNQQTSCPDPSSSSITEHEGQQLRLRTTGEITTTTQAESGLNRKGNHTISEYCHWEPKCHKNVEEVAVDVKGLQKSYTLRIHAATPGFCIQGQIQVKACMQALYTINQIPSDPRHLNFAVRSSLPVQFILKAQIEDSVLIRPCNQRNQVKYLYCTQFYSEPRPSSCWPREYIVFVELCKYYPISVFALGTD